MRRSPAAALVASAAALLPLAALVACSGEAPPRLNVLLITVDTLRADRLSGYGYDRATSPNIDAFLETAITFEDAQASSGWTMPSLASIMTSLHPSAHRCVKFDSRLEDAHLTLAEILGANGYRTHGIGSHTFLGESRGLQQGFADYDDELIANHERTAEHVSSRLITDRGIHWLEDAESRKGNEPWLLWLHYFDPHTTYVGHPVVSERFGTDDFADLYDGEIAFTDAELARVFHHLSKTGGDQNTIVVFAADHGEALGDHGGTRHETNLFAEVVQIPLAIRDPRLAPRRIEQPVQGLDILPTLLELLEIEVGHPMHGRSLADAMRGDELPERAFLAETEMFDYYVADSLTLGRWKLIADRSGGLERSSDDRVTLRPRAMARGAPGYYLFDRDSDPSEHIDVARRHPEIVEQLRTRLAAMLQVASTHERAGETSTRQRVSPEEMSALRSLGYVEGDPDP